MRPVWPDPHYYAKFVHFLLLKEPLNLLIRWDYALLKRTNTKCWSFMWSWTLLMFRRKNVVQNFLLRTKLSHVKHSELTVTQTGIRQSYPLPVSLSGTSGVISASSLWAHEGTWLSYEETWGGSFSWKNDGFWVGSLRFNHAGTWVGSFSLTQDFTWSARLTRGAANAEHTKKPSSFITLS